MISSMVLLCAIVVSEIVIFLVCGMLETHISTKLELTFREKVFRSVLFKDYSEVSKFHSGELLNRLFGDVTVITESVATLLPKFAALIARLVGAFSAMFFIDAAFSAILLVGGIALFCFARVFRGVMKRQHKSVQEANGEMRSFIQEASENFLVIKAFEMEDRIMETVGKRSKKYYLAKMKKALFSTGASAGFSSIMMGGYLYAVIWSAFKIIANTGFGFGDFTAIMQLITQVQSPFAGLSGSLSKYYAAIASAERLLEICDLPEEKLGEACDVAKTYDSLSSISVRNMSFSYGTLPVLVDASAEIEKGKLTVIAGSSGIGKSTLIKLIMGVLYPSSGELTAKLSGGASIELSASTRALFAYVPQGNLLMSGTIRENMLLARNDASDEEIFSALKVSCAEGFISEMPQGLDSVIGERGSGLSEGQAQRLAIARAILSGAPILLLDEATSALDEATEREVLSNIMALSDRTCIAISHRSAAREICDAEIRIEDGKIIKS